jgi:Holliday junction resolvase RusA-like endonuclease
MPKGRPQFNTYTKQARTPDATRAWNEVARYYMQQAARAHGLDEPLDVPLRVDVVFSYRGKGKARSPHTNKPDRDNLDKAVLDAGNGVIWSDDAVSWCGEPVKVWGETDCVIVRVTPCNDVPAWAHELLDAVAPQEVVE